MADLDGRFWKFGDNTKSFEWLVLQSGFKVLIPFKRTKMWTKWEGRGFTLSNSIRLKYDEGSLTLEFFFEKEKPPLKPTGAVEGIDLGYVNTITCTNGQVIGAGMNKVIESFSKREKHTHEQIKNRIFHELKSLNISNVKKLAIENLKSVKSNTRGKFSRKRNRRLSHWLYAKVVERLARRCEEEGVRLVSVSPWKTSQYCRFCNNWDRRNRKGEVFKCVVCGHTDHADMNGAMNIKLLGLAEAYSLRSLPSNFMGVRNECL
ncbi:MAG: zinc ribbon domain-containing protein [Euryarchaeota archaeon]|nr:zinc ribbon domain-containing protein [Euryarchaeota archaeon]